MRSLLLCLFCVLVVFGQTPYEFTASKALIYNDPLVAGTLVVDVQYDASMNQWNTQYPSANRGSAPTTQGVMAIKYLNSAGQTVMDEVYDFFFRFRFQHCTDCVSATYKAPMPRFYKTTSGQATDSYYTTTVPDATVNGIVCKGFSNPSAASSASKSLWIDIANNRPCRHQWGSGKTIDFLTSQAGNSFSASAISDTSIMSRDGNQNWRPTAAQFPWTSTCLAPSCKVKIDIIVVLDDSSSISNPSWGKAREFTANFFTAFSFGPQDVQGGVVKFAWSASLPIPLTIDKQSLLSQVNTLPHNGGSTCTGCGISQAQTELVGPRSRNGVPKVMVVITDGYNNQQTSAFPSVVAAARAVPIEIFGIGVGSFLDSTISSFVSSPIADHKFLVDDYDQLATVLNTVITAACQDVPGTLCGAGCAGLCLCGTDCKCPPSCEDFDSCTNDNCVDGQNSNGCVYTTVNCNPNNDVCNVYTCDSQTGCQSTPLDCDDNDPCTIDACGDPNDPTNANRIQCTHTPRDCNDNNICTTDTCNSASLAADPCVHTLVDDCSKCLHFDNSSLAVDCSLERFNPNWQLFTPCNPYVCNPQSPNARYDLNDPLATNVNNPGPCEAHPIVCNDNNPCTSEVCNTTIGACQYTGFLACDDNDPCTDNVCDPTAPDAASACSNPDYDPNIICYDGLFCTTDLCNHTAPDVDSRCYHTPLDCSINDECQITACDENFQGCVQQNRSCTAGDSCHAGTCIPQHQGPTPEDYNVFNSTYCVYDVIPGTVTSCGVCLGNEVSCYLNSGAAVYAIAGGVIAAIVIAIVIALALGVFGAKKGYDYLKRKNQNHNWSEKSAGYVGKPSGSNPRAK